jgi:hypothetical protein
MEMVHGRVVFKQYISKKHKCFGVKIFKLCDMAGNTNDMSICFEENRPIGNTNGDID